VHHCPKICFTHTKPFSLFGNNLDTSLSLGRVEPKRGEGEHSPAAETSDPPASGMMNQARRNEVVSELFLTSRRVAPSNPEATRQRKHLKLHRNALELRPRIIGLGSASCSA
jgi:hypothetical protein